MKVITLLNSKGGTGKSTFATHLAGGLAIAGHRVLIIDADSQGNATTALNLPKAPLFHDLVVRGASWRDSILAVHTEVFAPREVDGSLFCVAGNIETKSIPNIIDDETVIANRLRELEGTFDYVILDTSPTASLLHSMLHAATDYLILPTQLEGHSALEGLPESIQRAERVRKQAAKYGLDICRVIGVLPNMFRSNTLVHQQVLDHIRITYGDLVWEPIGLRITIPEANLANRLVYAYAPDSRAAHELYGVTENVLQRMEVFA